MRIEFKLVSYGWMLVSVTKHDMTVVLWASYLTDALGDLLHALRLLCEGVDESSCLWNEEPALCGWLFKMTHDGGVRTRILRTTEAFLCGPDDPDATVVFDLEIDLASLVAAVLAGVSDLLNKHGRDGYAEIWDGDEFPEVDFNFLMGWTSPASS